MFGDQIAKSRERLIRYKNKTKICYVFVCVPEINIYHRAKFWGSFKYIRYNSRRIFHGLVCNAWYGNKENERILSTTTVKNSRILLVIRS